MKYVKCTSCGKNVSTSNIKRHTPKCIRNILNPPPPKKIRGVDFDPNHGYKNGRSAWNKGLTKETNSSLRQLADSLSKTLSQSPKHGCCAWTKDQRSKNAKQMGLGGYRPNAGRSKKFPVIDSQGNHTTLQSTYELECFNILTDLKIRWMRPKALKYDGKNYFADFYLLDYDVWLDTKNDYKARLDEPKINAVIHQNDVKLFVLLKHQITKDFITTLVKLRSPAPN